MSESHRELITGRMQFSLENLAGYVFLQRHSLYATTDYDASCFKSGKQDTFCWVEFLNNEQAICCWDLNVRK